MKWITTVIGSLMTSLVAASPATQERLLSDVEIIPGGNGAALVVLLHGYTLDGDSLMTVQKTLNRVDRFKGADVLRPTLPLGTFSMATSSQIAAELLQAIDTAWEKKALSGKPYERIAMVGHSAGALYARKIYAVACGENKDAPFEKSLGDSLASLGASPPDRVRPWAGAVDRMVLLAGMNRGWSISHHMSIPRAVMMQAGVAVGHVIDAIRGRPPIIFSVRRGSSFITQLRLQWLEMRKQADRKKVGAAVTVQLLGTIDDLVSPDDNIDLISGRDFRYLEVPESGHKNVIEMDGSEAGMKRQAVLLQAFDDSQGQALALAEENAFWTERPKVTDVVFVIHGIRDQGFWTSKIARRVQQAGSKNNSERIIAAETSTYGYFPMLSFLRPGARQEKVEWLMDRYTEARATYPNASFHYVGHSNGTYLFVKALQDYPSVSFDQVVFAGSVVKRDFKWEEFVPNRVKRVLNFVATSDWVVAFFPKAMQSMSVQDLGSAGHDGFDAAQTHADVIEPETYIIGGHSAALQEAMWDSIADFVVTGVFQPPPPAIRSDEQAQWVKYPGTVAPLLIFAIAGILLFILYRLFRLEIGEWQKTLAIIAYLTVVWTVLTKV